MRPIQQLNSRQAKYMSALKGVLSFPVTPFTEDLSLDLAGFRSNLERCCNEDFSSIFVCCGAGEFHALTASEYQTLLDISAEVIDKRKPWFAGVGMGLSQACQQMEIATTAGADGVLAFPPYLVTPDSQGLIKYFRQIAQSANLAVILYQRNNAIFSLETLEALAQEANIIGFKDGLGNLEKFRQFTAQFGDRFAWLSGMPTAEMTFEAYYASGAEGFSSAIANFAPHLAFEFFKAATTNDHARCASLLRDFVTPLCQIRARKEGYAVSLVKAAMNLVGLPAGPVRPPLPELSESDHRDLKTLLGRNGLLASQVTTLSSHE